MAEYIGRYEIKRELERGGMATVFLAFDPRFHRQVAIKVLPRQFTHDPRFLSRFEQEARIIATLEHPAIVPVHDFGEHNDAPYLVMRYMAGGNLRQRLSGEFIALEEIVAALNRVSPALDYAHQFGIVHRDLKPSNILFDHEGRPYLADFGIARLAEASHTITIIGTPAYMSPEQAESKVQLDGRSDIYAMGVILFELLSGRQPYVAETPTGQMLRHILEPVPDVREDNPGLPPEAQHVIEKAMAKDREQRYQSAGELATAVANLVTVIARDSVAEAIDEDASVQLATSILAEASPPAVKANEASGLVDEALIADARTVDKKDVIDKTPPVREDERVASLASAASVSSTESLRNRRWLLGSLAVAGLLIIGMGMAYAAGFFQTNGDGSESLSLTSQDDEANVITIAETRRNVATVTTSPIPPTKTTTPRPSATPDLALTAESYFAKYNDYMASEEYSKAALIISEAIERNPNEASYLFERAKVNRILKRYQPAMEDIEQAIALEPDVAAYYAERGNIRRDSGDINAALEDYETALEMDPENTAIYIELADAYQSMEDIEMAVTTYDAIIDLEPDNDTHYKSRADLLLIQSDEAAAAADLEKAIELNPRKSDYYWQLGQIYSWPLEDHARSVENFNKAIALKPNEAWFYAMRANSLNGLGNNDAALGDINQAIEMYAENPWYFETRGDIFRAAGDYQNAIADYNRCLDLDPNQTWCHAKQGQIYLYDLHDLEKALVEFDRAIDLDPTSPWLFIHRGDLHSEFGNSEKALADFESAIDLATTNREVANSHFRLGLAYLNNFDDPEAALSEFNEAINIDPGNADAYRSRGYDYYFIHARDLDEALADLNRAIELDPSVASWYDLRGQVLGDMGDLASAESDYERCLALESDNYWCHNNLAWLYDRIGDQESALDHFREFLRLIPESQCPECQENATEYINSHGG